MKRFYVCDVIGTGTEADPYRPAVADHPVSWAGVIKGDAIGRPAKPWALVVAMADDQSGLINDTRLDALPDVALGHSVREIAQSVKTALQGRLTAREIATLVRDDDSFGVLVRKIGRELEPTFDEMKLRTG